MKQMRGNKNIRFSVIGAILLLIAVVLAVVVMVLTSPHMPKALPTPAQTVSATVEPAPIPTPTPAPDITSIKLYAFGRELTADGFTMYIGDQPIELTAMIEPEGLNYAVEWSFSDGDSASLEGSGQTCTITALKPSGKNELTVVCHNLYTAIPVYLWEK